MIISEEEAKKLTDMNFKLGVLIGYALSMARELKRHVSHDDEEKIQWFIHEVDKVIYDNQ